MDQSFFRSYLTALGVDNSNLSPEEWVSRSFADHLHRDAPSPGSARGLYRPAAFGGSGLDEATFNRHDAHLGFFNQILTQFLRDIELNFMPDSLHQFKAAHPAFFPIRNAIALYVSIVAFSAPDWHSERSERNVRRAVRQLIGEIAAALDLPTAQVELYGGNEPFELQPGDHTFLRRIEILTKVAYRDFVNNPLREARHQHDANAEKMEV